MQNKKDLTIKEFATMGGQALKKKVEGTDYYDRIREKGRKVLLEKDPDFYKKLSAAGLHAREVKKQKEIQEMWPKKPTEQLVKILSGS